MSLAIPKDVEYPGVQWFEGRKIATSYPGILSTFLKTQNVNAEIHVITGSVEVAPGIGLADAIFDIVSSGSTLVSNRLREVEVVMKSEMTPLLEIAKAKGCRYVIGTAMLFEMIPAYLEFFGFGTSTPDELRAVAKIQY